MDAEIFVSYSSKESCMADYICRRLEMEGLSCWIAHRNIPVGSDYSEQIPDAIANCKVFLLLMSEHAQKSKYVVRELNEAVDHEKVVIPFYIKETQLDNKFQFFLKRYQHIEGYYYPTEEELLRDTDLDEDSIQYRRFVGLRTDSIELLIRQVKAYLNDTSEHAVHAKHIPLSPPQPNSEIPEKEQTKPVHKPRIVCPKCRNGNLRRASYWPEQIAEVLEPVFAKFISVYTGGIIAFCLWVKNIANEFVGDKKIENLSDLLSDDLLLLDWLSRLIVFLILAAVMIGVLQLLLNAYREHFQMIKKCKMRIWTFRCCSCMQKFSVIGRDTDKLEERVPNLVKEPGIKGFMSK